MALQAEIKRGWDEHGDAPEAVAAEMVRWVELAEPADLPALLGLLVHLFGEHLGDAARALSLLQVLARRHSAPGLDRALAAFHLVAGDQAAHDALLARLAEQGPRHTHESRILAMAAGAVGARGRAAEAGSWLVRAVNLTYELPDKDDAVRQVATVANNLASSLEEQLKGRAIDPNSEEVKLLRFSSSVARAAWERAGGWLEVERAEYRLAMSSLVVGEPYGAVAHAEACRAICEANGAEPLELAYAHEALARSRDALEDRAGVSAARESIQALIAEAGEQGQHIEALLARLDRDLAEHRPGA